MKRFYIKATGSACYDKSGLTFPKQIQYCFATEVKAQGGTNLRWALHYGWNNQPKVLCFNATEEQAKAIDKSLDTQVGRYFIVLQKDW